MCERKGTICPKQLFVLDMIMYGVCVPTHFGVLNMTSGMVYDIKNRPRIWGFKNEYSVCGPYHYYCFFFCFFL